MDVKEDDLNVSHDNMQYDSVCDLVQLNDR